MWPTSRPRARLGRFDRRRRATRGGVLARAADPGAAQGARIARSPISRPPASTASRCACRIIRSRATLLAAFGRPVVAPSANRSGHVSPTTARARAGRSARPHRAHRRRRPDAAWDWNRPSSPASASPMLLRPGALPRAEIERVLGRPLATAAAASGRSSGRARPARLALRAARAAAARCDERRGRRSAAGVRPGCSPPTPNAPRACSTSRRAATSSRPPPTCSRTCARSTPRRPAIAVMPVPHEGLGEAINDRLARAAAPRGRVGAKQGRTP